MVWRPYVSISNRGVPEGRIAVRAPEDKVDVTL